MTTDADPPRVSSVKLEHLDPWKACSVLGPGWRPDGEYIVRFNIHGTITGRRKITDGKVLITEWCRRAVLNGD